MFPHIYPLRVPLYIAIKPVICYAGNKGTNHSLDLSDDQLHELAWGGIVASIFTEKRRAARNRFLTYAGENSQMISDDLELVVQAAYYEAVDTLFVPVGVQKWGAFDPLNNHVNIHNREQVGDTDLLDFVASIALRNLEVSMHYHLKTFLVKDCGPRSCVTSLNLQAHIEGRRCHQLEGSGGQHHTPFSFGNSIENVHE